MDIKITPNRLKGNVTMPPSKSAAHRLLICAALSRNESYIKPKCTSDDIKATVSCLKEMGANIKETLDGYVVSRGETNKNSTLDFCESGSTARFLLPIAAAIGSDATMIGRGRLPKRPMAPLTNVLREYGVEVSSDNLPITIKGSLNAGRFELAGNISSQYVSGLLFAAPLLKEESQINLTSPLESTGYVDMTLKAMSEFGVGVEKGKDSYKIKPQEYKGKNMVIEGDWSQAAFFMSAAAIGSEIQIEGLDLDSLQGDKACLDIFARFGADVSVTDNKITVKKNRLEGITVDASNIPDMVPAIAATAAFAKGKTVIHSAERLRLKESDRIKTTIAALNQMGIKTEEKPDGMIIYGAEPKGVVIDGAGDHRIVMAFSVAAAYAKGESVITGAEAISKSYPEFFSEFKKLEGKVNEIECR